MLRRTLLIFLLVISLLTTTGASRPSLPQDETTGTTQEDKLTPEEEREARALAAEFIKRLEETDDVTPLLSELYVSDFVTRLHESDEVEGLFPLACKREVAAQATPDEIRRAYIASINGSYLGMRLVFTAYRRLKQEQSKNQTGEPKLRLEEVIPPDVMKLIESDPLLNAALEKELKSQKAEREAQERNDSQSEAAPAPQAADNDEADAADDESDDELFDHVIPFQNLEQMRHYTSLLEEGVKLLRAHFNALPPEQRLTLTQALNEIYKESDDKEAAERKETIWPQLHLVEYPNFMGYETGTRVIRVEVQMFRLEMVRDDKGQLKIAFAQFYMD